MGLPDPEFHSDGAFVQVVFRYVQDTVGQNPTSTRQATGQATGQVTGQVASLIRYLGDQELSVKEMMERLSLKGRDNFLNNYLYPSLKEGWIEPLYPQQPKHPRQKYRLTEKGKTLLEKDF